MPRPRQLALTSMSSNMLAAKPRPKAGADRRDRPHVRRRLGSHLLAQIISFGIVCAVLYCACLQPILEDPGGPAAADRQWSRQRREDQGRSWPESRRTPGHPGQGRSRREAVDRRRPRLPAASGRAKRRRRSPPPNRSSSRARGRRARPRAMLAELKREVGRLVVQTTGSGDGQDSDRRGSAAAGRRPPASSRNDAGRR